MLLLATMGVYEAIGDEEESIEADGIACLAEASGVPLESSVYVADVEVKVNAGVAYASVKVIEIKVEEAVFETEV